MTANKPNHAAQHNGPDLRNRAAVNKSSSTTGKQQ
jgi:hypothetical protein